MGFREDLWGAIEILHERFSRVDHAKLIACDIVSKITSHFEKIREAKTAVLVFKSSRTSLVYSPSKFLRPNKILTERLLEDKIHSRFVPTSA